MQNPDTGNGTLESAAMSTGPAPSVSSSGGGRVMPKPSGSARRVQRLDGLRAIAVLAVIAYHLELGWAQGVRRGLFFTLVAI